MLTRLREDKISIISSEFQTGYPRGDPRAILVTITATITFHICQQNSNKTSCILKQKAHKALTKWTIRREIFSRTSIPLLLYEIDIWGLDWGQAMGILYCRGPAEFLFRDQRFDNRPAIRQIFKTIKA